MYLALCDEVPNVFLKFGINNSNVGKVKSPFTNEMRCTAVIYEIVR